jgi:hypothetical protein
MTFALESTQGPEAIEVPASISGRRFERVEGAKYREQDQRIMIDPAAKSWSVVWL